MGVGAHWDSKCFSFGDKNKDLIHIGENLKGRITIDGKNVKMLLSQGNWLDFDFSGFERVFRPFVFAQNIPPYI
jgi:hypothetical protein